MKSLIIAAVLVVGILLCACAPTENTPAGTSTPDVIVLPTKTASADTTAEPHDIPAAPEAEQNIDEARENIENMMPILDSIVRTTGTVGDIEYAPEDSEFFWRVLYLVGNNWGATHPLIKVDGDDKTIGNTHVPSSVMEEFARAAFYTFKEFPAIPESLNSSIWFDEEADTYVHSPSDMGGTQTILDDISVAQDGSVTAKVGLYDGAATPEDILGYVLFTLVKHPYSEGISNSIYLYSVTGATKIPV